MQNALILALALLAVAVLLRARIRMLQVLYIPASILGGLIGLAAGPSLLGWIPPEIVAHLASWPGWLIAVIFAGLFLDRPTQPLGHSLRGALRQGIMVWIIVFGQAALGILVTWLVVADRFDVPHSFGQLIEAGFAGGHGTAAAMGKVYRSQDFQEGPDLAFLVATVGLIYGVISGIALVRMLQPVVLLLLLGFAYVAFCALVLAPRLLPRDYWFELGLINYGMSTGTTATGLMLLRIIDSDFRSPAPADYALAAPLSAPFIGGGIITFTLPFLMERVSAGIVGGVMFLILFLLYGAGRFLASDQAAR